MTNFNQNKDAVSGPLAIVAAGADIARNDAASLMQFAAIVNVNLAMVNALPLPVSFYSFQTVSSDDLVICLSSRSTHAAALGSGILSLDAILTMDKKWGVHHHLVIIHPKPYYTTFTGSSSMTSLIAIQPKEAWHEFVYRSVWLYSQVKFGRTVD